MPPKLFFQPTFDSYIRYFQRTDIINKLINTIIIASGSALLSIVVGSMAGYALARIKLKGASVFGVIILLSRGVPPIALAVPIFLVARKYGLTDKHITLIVAYATFLIPYVMWLMRGFRRCEGTEEAALIRRCSRSGFRAIIVRCRAGHRVTFISP